MTAHETSVHRDWMLIAAGDLGKIDPFLVSIFVHTPARYTLILLRRAKKTPEGSWGPGAHVEAPLFAFPKTIFVRVRPDAHPPELGLMCELGASLGHSYRYSSECYVCYLRA